MVNRSRGIFAISQGVKDNFCNLLLQYCDHADFGSVKLPRAFMECGQAAKCKNKHCRCPGGERSQAPTGERRAAGQGDQVATGEGERTPTRAP